MDGLSYEHYDDLREPAVDDRCRVVHSHLDVTGGLVKTRTVAPVGTLGDRDLLFVLVKVP